MPPGEAHIGWPWTVRNARGQLATDPGLLARLRDCWCCLGLGNAFWLAGRSGARYRAAIPADRNLTRSCLMIASFVYLPESLLAQAAAQDDLPLGNLLVVDLLARWNNGQRPTV